MLDGDGILTLRCRLASDAFGRLREKAAPESIVNVRCRLLRCIYGAVKEVDATP